MREVVIEARSDIVARSQRIIETARLMEGNVRVSDAVGLLRRSLEQCLEVTRRYPRTAIIRNAVLAAVDTLPETSCPRSPSVRRR